MLAASPRTNKEMKTNIPPDFIAVLTYKTHEQGGRSLPVVSGYRPGITFPFDKMQTTGQQIFMNKELVYPGDVVEAEIRIPSVEYFANQLTEGMTFNFSEGETIIGTGEIKQIINERLRKASR